MQEDAALRVLDYGCNAGAYGQPGLLRRWAFEVTHFLLPAYQPVPPLAGSGVDETSVDRPAGVIGSA